MDEADPKRRDMQEKLLKQIVNLKYDRALDVACGRGLLTELFLMKKYKKVDLFDTSRNRVKQLVKKFILEKNVT